MAASMMDRLTGGDPGSGRKSAPQVKALYEKALAAQRFDILRHQVIQSYIGGDQYVFVDRVRNALATLPRDESRARITDNRIASNTRTVYAKLLKREMVFEVPPSASDDATIRGARIAEAAANDLANRQRWEQLRRQALAAMWQGGTSVLCVDWDSNVGTPLGATELGRSFATGDVRCAALTISEAFTEPGTTDIETAGWWIRAQALPASVVKDHYSMDKVPATDTNAQLGPSARHFAAGDRREVPIPLTLVLTYYERPQNGSKGRVCSVVGNEVVADDPWPFPFTDRLNCVAVRESYVDNRWSGETIVYQAVSLQNALNAAMSSVIEHLKKAGNARLMVPDMSLDLIDELTDDPGEIVPYNSTAGAPSYLSPPQLPAWYTDLAERIAERIDDVMGVHAVSRGESPTNIQSGVGLSILAEQDDTPIGFMAKEMAEAFGRLMSMCLDLYANKVTESRTAKIVIPGGVTESVKWSGKSFLGQTEAEIPIEAVIPRSRAQSEARALELVKLNLIKTPEDYALVADIPRRDNFADQMNPAMAKARRENQELAMGKVCIPADFDNHRVHTQVHNTFRMSQMYELLTDPERAVIDMHVQAHENLAAEDAAKKLQQTAISPALAAAPEANEGEPLPVAPGGNAPAGGPMPGQPAPDEQQQQVSSPAAPDPMSGGITP